MSGLLENLTNPVLAFFILRRGGGQLDGMPKNSLFLLTFARLFPFLVVWRL